MDGRERHEYVLILILFIFFTSRISTLFYYAYPQTEWTVVMVLSIFFPLNLISVHRSTIYKKGKYI